MSSDLEIHQDERIIKITVTGELNANRVLELIDKISLAVKLYHGRNILVDIRDNPFQSDMADLLGIASECSKRFIDFKRKIAFLIPDTKGQKNVAKLFRTCMEIQGFEFRQFVAYDDAMAWISS